MIKKISLMALLAATTLASNAQKVNYSVLETDPDKAKTTMLDIQFLNVGMFQGINLGYGLRFETMLTEKIAPFVSYQGNYINSPSSSDPNEYNPVAVGGLKGLSTTELGGIYFLGSRKTQANVKVKLSQMSFGSVSIIHYTTVPSTIKHMVGVRGGVTYYQEALDLDNDAHPYYRYKSKDGKIIMPIDEQYNGSTNYPGGKAEEPFTNFKTFAIFAGIDYRNIRNTAIQAEDYGRCVNMTNFDIYFDLMAAPMVSVDNVVDAEKKEWQILPQSKALSRFGYRFGLGWHSGRNIGFSETFEFGKKPCAIAGSGFFNNGGYFAFNFGLTIATAKNLLGKKAGGSATKTAPKVDGGNKI